MPTTSDHEAPDPAHNHFIAPCPALTTQPHHYNLHGAGEIARGTMETMRGLVVDYCGVLDGSEEDRRRWKKLLTAIKAEGISISILSNDPGGKNAAPIRAWAEAGFVDHVILSGEVGAEKPSVEIFDITAQRMGLARKDLILVDDSILNVRGAVEAGLIGVYYQQFERATVEIQGLFDIDGEF